MDRCRVTAVVLGLVLVLGCKGSKGDVTTGSGASGSSKPAVSDGGPASPAVSDGGSTAGEDPDPASPPPAPTVRPGPGDCKTEYAPRPKRDPNPMCKIPGGVFEMGDPKGAHRPVEVSPYLLDQFEVTNAQVQFFLEATRYDERCKRCFNFGVQPPPAVTKSAEGGYVIADGAARRPYAYITRDGAEAYCAWAGKVLPTEAEWEFAARHDPVTNRDRLLPWGDKEDPKRARCECDGVVHMQSLRPINVGSYDGTNGLGDGRSPWGVHDLVGNAREIVVDCEGDWKVCDGPCRDPITAGRNGRCLPVFRGGASTSSGQFAVGYERGLDSGGFRCAISSVKR